MAYNLSVYEQQAWLHVYIVKHQVSTVEVSLSIDICACVEVYRSVYMDTRDCDAHFGSLGDINTEW